MWLWLPKYRHSSSAPSFTSCRTFGTYRKWLELYSSSAFPSSTSRATQQLPFERSNWRICWRICKRWSMNVRLDFPSIRSRKYLWFLSGIKFEGRLRARFKKAEAQVAFYMTLYMRFIAATIVGCYCELFFVPLYNSTFGGYSHSDWKLLTAYISLVSSLTDLNSWSLPSILPRSLPFDRETLAGFIASYLVEAISLGVGAVITVTFIVLFISVCTYVNVCLSCVDRVFIQMEKRLNCPIHVNPITLKRQLVAAIKMHAEILA